VLPIIVGRAVYHIKKWLTVYSNTQISINICYVSQTHFWQIAGIILNLIKFSHCKWSITHYYAVLHRIKITWSTFSLVLKCTIARDVISMSHRYNKHKNVQIALLLNLRKKKSSNVSCQSYVNMYKKIRQYTKLGQEIVYWVRSWLLQWH
jgi:hypothetical protein